MKQSGFLHRLNPSDYILGVNSPLIGIEINSSGDWIDFMPSEENQFVSKFDTMCCSTFSATNALETLMNYLLKKGEFSYEQIKFCNDEGYIVNGKFNFSDRWSATSNGTMPNGQYINVVWDDFRTVGLISENDLPFGGSNQSEYLDKRNLTKERYAKAKRFMEIMFEKDSNGKYKINYEFIPIETGIELNSALKQSPVQVAVTREIPSHAIMLLRMDKEFESYPPHFRSRNRTIAYALKPIIKIKKMEKPYVEIKRISSDSNQTIGVLEAYRNGSKFTCKTLELPYKSNMAYTSCIPKGEYIVEYTFSFGKLGWTYEIKNVKNRSGIRIHSANYYYQLKGCISLGESLIDINNDGKMDTSNSRATIGSFENFMGKKPFTLKIL